MSDCAVRVWTVTLCLLWMATHVVAQAPIKAEIAASGLKQPVYVTHAPGDFGRIFILELHAGGTTGQVRVFDLESQTLLPEPYLAIPVLSDGEAGLVGMAFHPNYAENGYVYVNYLAPGGGEFGQTIVERYTVSEDDPNLADPDSANVIIRYDQPNAVHNAGWLDFNPTNGHLHIASGDGGSSINAQNTDLLLGKIIRIDVDGDDFPLDDERDYAIPADNPFAGGGGAPEIWSWGFRNPWRCSFDEATGDFYMGDVGGSLWEEVNYEPADFEGGANYGWVCAEGPLCNQTCCGCELEDCDSYRYPVHAFDHSVGNAMAGGYVYRGCAIPELEGRYFFAAIGSGRVFSLVMEDGQATDLQEHTDALTVPGIEQFSKVSFGQDAYGELYIAIFTGNILRIVRDGPPLNDCNANGVEDACDILDGTLTDSNGDGTPDECESDCLADFNDDGETNVLDFIAYQEAFAGGDPEADCNEDGMLNILDFVCFQAAFADGCP